VTYRVREVDTSDEEIAQELRDLQQITFGNSAPLVDPEAGGWWWIAYKEDVSVGFAQLVQSTYGPEYGYLKRSGVADKYRGHGLQLRLIRAREQRAKRNGWQWLISETTDNPPSANNLIRAGFKIFEPAHGRWAFNHSIYWRKQIAWK
jgi:GNAT superfamily N-acetyltransferase